MQKEISPDTKYKIEINNKEYYPAMLDVEFGENGKPYFPKEGVVGMHYFFPEEKILQDKIRSLDAKYFNHLIFQTIEKEPPKVFIRKNLAEALTNGKSHLLKKINSDKIINAHEIEDYNKFFRIFRGDKEPEDRFSKFKGTSSFPKSD